MLRFLLLRNSCESGGPPSTFAGILEDLRPFKAFCVRARGRFSGLLNPYWSLDLGHRINRVKVGHVPHNSCAQGWDSFILQQQSGTKLQPCGIRGIPAQDLQDEYGRSLGWL